MVEFLALLFSFLTSDTSVVILSAEKGRSTVIVDREDYLEKCMDHTNNGPYQLL